MIFYRKEDIQFTGIFYKIFRASSKMPERPQRRTYRPRATISRSNRPHPPGLKKTTKKGAYAKTAKANFGKRRRPFVETKTREAITVNMANRTPPAMGQTFDPNYPNVLDFVNLPVDDAFTLLEPRSFTRMCQGLEEDKMVGESVFSRYIKQKITFRYPGGNSQIAYGHNMYVISGWITNPIALTNQTGNTWNGHDIPTQGDIDMDALKSYIAYNVKQYYNEREDKMRFIPKRTTNIKINSFRKITSDRNSVNAMLPNDGGALSATASGGQLPDIHTSVTWKTGRKVHYVRGKDTALAYPPATGEDTQNFFCNWSWLPWTVIYNPDFATQHTIADTDPKTPAIIKLCHNDQHWYTDA